VFVAEVQNNRISVWTREDAESTDWSNQTTFGVKGSGRGQLEFPTDIFVTADGLTAFVADHYNHRISVWSRDAAESTDWNNQTTFGSQGSGASNFYWPTGVFASKDGRTVFVGDTENGRVSVWTLS
jgi:DNA-binding beta-propeller fold protein YncE